jgi:hypothetical protein
MMAIEPAEISAKIGPVSGIVNPNRLHGAV